MSPERSLELLEPIERRRREFVSLFHFYRRRHRWLKRNGVGPYRFTALGAWAASRPPHVFSFFRRLHLERCRLFLDLGSGDGVVSCIAGLFTQSVGIEVDAGLCQVARQAALALGLEDRVHFICADYRTQALWKADCLYIYPDKPFHDLEALLQGWPGLLLVYGPHFPPDGFVPVQRLRCGRERMVAYKSASTPLSLSLP